MSDPNVIRENQIVMDKIAATIFAHCHDIGYVKLMDTAVDLGIDTDAIWASLEPLTKHQLSIRNMFKKRYDMKRSKLLPAPEPPSRDHKLLWGSLAFIAGGLTLGYALGCMMGVW